MKKEGKEKTQFDLKVFLICLAIVYFTAYLGSRFTSKEVNSDWYEQIKPSITPPNYIFPIVWAILFFLIALSLYFLWVKSTEKLKKKVAFIFAVNLILNVFWSYFYFFIKNIQYAFLDLILLEASIIAMVLIAWKIDKKSAYLLIPYLIWVAFAGVLNYLSIIK
jgi:tryptophan-rich sensory protein